MKEEKLNKGEIVIYETADKGVDLKVRLDRDTVWLSLDQIAGLFGRDKSVVSRHLKNIFKEKELDRDSVVAKIATTAADGKTYQVEYHNLDVIISVGYRVNSKRATQFRIWATKILKQHLVKGYTINKSRISHNYQQFLKAVSDVKALLPENDRVKARDVLELVNAFAGTWLSLEVYDGAKFPKKGATKRQVSLTAEELEEALAEFKKKLLAKKQATEIFGKERNRDAVRGIVGNVMQSFGGNDLYSSVEEKSAHLLYFIVKNHPFIDGNKRSGAFAFVWFLKKTGLLRASFTPEALTALTLLVAESHPKDKDKMTGVVLLLLQKK